MSTMSTTLARPDPGQCGVRDFFGHAVVTILLFIGKIMTYQICAGVSVTDDAVRPSKVCFGFLEPTLEILSAHFLKTIHDTI